MLTNGPFSWLTLLAAITLGTPAVAQLAYDPEAEIYYRETAHVALNGNIWNYWPGKDEQREPINAMVCGLSGPDSFLSVRIKPTPSAAEQVRLAPFATVSLTGEVSPDHEWAVIDSTYGAVDPDGVEYSELPQEVQPLAGWVSTRYLCDFIH